MMLRWKMKEEIQDDGEKKKRKERLLRKRLGLLCNIMHGRLS